MERFWDLLWTIIRILLAVLAVFVLWHVIPALAVRDNEPARCYLTGGHWNAWNGWRCG